MENFICCIFAIEKQLKKMKKNKTIILMWMLLTITSIAFANQRSVYMEFHRKGIPEKNMEVNRAPMRMPIEVVYDANTHKIEVAGNTAIRAEVFLYKANGILENYSSSLNTDFVILASGVYIIQIQGDGWYAEGNIEI